VQRPSVIVTYCKISFVEHFSALMNKLPSELKQKLAKQQDAFKSLEEQMGNAVPPIFLWSILNASTNKCKAFWTKRNQNVKSSYKCPKKRPRDQKKAAAEKAAAEKAEKIEKAAAERAAAERAAAERVAAEKAEKAEKAAAERAAAERTASEKAEKAEKAAAEKAESTEKSVEADLFSPRSRPVESSTVVQLAAQDKLVGGQKFQLQLEHRDAKRRIISNPQKGMADLTDDELADVWIRLRDDEDPLNWMVMGYIDGGNPDAIKIIGKGQEGFNEMKSALPDAPVYMYLRYLFGDTGRSKFVFLTYVPDTLSGLRKAKVVQHRPAVTKFVKYFQIEWHVLRKDELVVETLEKKLLAAGGANYSVQAEDKGDFKSYKGSTATFHGIKQ